MAIDSLENVGASGVWSQVELRIQRKQLESVMGMGSSGWGARSHIADGLPEILGLNGAVRQRRVRRNAFWQFVSGAGNIEDHPVQNVAGILLECDIRVVQDQRESDRARRNVGPLQLGRNRIRIGLRVLSGNLAAVGEC